MAADSADYQEVVFCERCVAASRDETSGDVTAVNGIGRKFSGRAGACSGCGSVIRTPWWTFVYLPAIPLVSHRYQKWGEGSGKTESFSRRVALHWPQVLKTWLVGALAVAAPAWPASRRGR